MADMDEKANRSDPYKHFKYRVKWDGRYVAGVSRIDALTRSEQVVSPSDGEDTGLERHSPSLTNYSPITLERGVTHDKEFEQWANKVWHYGAGMNPEVSLKDFRKNIDIDMYNEAGQLVISYKVYRCWVSDFTAMPDLDASGNAVAIQSMTLQNEGWDRESPPPR